MSLPKDACGKDIRVGDTVMLASTGKSAGIGWTRCVVSRVSEKSFWHRSSYRGSDYESGPRRPSNCIVVEEAP